MSKSAVTFEDVHNDSIRVAKFATPLGSPAIEVQVVDGMVHVTPEVIEATLHEYRRLNPGHREGDVGIHLSLTSLAAFLEQTDHRRIA